MFKKDPSKKLQKQYEALMKEARDTQRAGDIVKYSELVTQATELLDRLQQIREERNG